MIIKRELIGRGTKPEGMLAVSIFGGGSSLIIDRTGSGPEWRVHEGDAW